jgi:hypothetical protein
MARLHRGDVRSARLDLRPPHNDATMAKQVPAASALTAALACLQRLHAERATNPILAGALDRVALWQALRLQMTYADLVAQARYVQAIDFFRTDLYGPGDFSRRDEDLARVVPLLVHMLPARTLEVFVQAVELNALSRELDRVLVAKLPRVDGAMTVSDYCRGYRRAGNFSARRRQIGLIGEVGRALDRNVGKAWVRASLAVMRKPARMAGLQSLQDLLERGVAAFRRMRGADEFLSIIQARETQIHEDIVAGSNEPFGDPVLAASNPSVTAHAAL